MTDKNKKSLAEMFKLVCEQPINGGVEVDFLQEILPNNNNALSKPHLHPFYEIIWFQEGTGIHTVDFCQYEVKTNSIFFLAPGQVHHFDTNTDYKGVIIKIRSEYMKSDDGQTNLFLKYNDFRTFDASPYYCVDDATAHELDLVLEAMNKEQSHPNAFGAKDLQRCLVWIFMIAVQRSGRSEGEFRLDLLKPSHRLFVLFRRKLEQEFMHIHTVNEYAEALNVTTRTLCKSVSECAHRTPLSFINERLLLEAKRMLLYTDMMVKEISYNLGFEDPSYFIKFFKRELGILPSEYRENMGNGEAFL